MKKVYSSNGLKKPTVSFSSIGKKKQAVVIAFAIFGVVFLYVGYNSRNLGAFLYSAYMFFLISGFPLYYFLRIEPAKEAKQIRKGYIEREDREKTIAYKKDAKKYQYLNELDIAEHERAVENIYKTAAIVRSSVNLQNQFNSAELGGTIASIAGVQAGMKVAGLAEIANEKIRQDNAKKIMWADDMARKMTDATNSKKAPKSMTLDQIKKEYIIDYSWSPETLFNTISFDTKYNIAQDEKTRSVEISVDWSIKQSLTWFDGSIRAKLYNPENRCVGCAYLYLPKEGTKEEKGTLKGIIPIPKTEGPYTVKFEPIDLWGFYKNSYQRYCKPSDGLTKAQHDVIVQKYEQKYQNEIL